MSPFSLFASSEVYWAGPGFSGHTVFNKLQRDDLIISVGVKTLTLPTPPGIPSQSYCCVRVEVFAGPVVTTHIAGLLSSPDLSMAFFVPTRASDM